MGRCCRAFKRPLCTLAEFSGIHSTAPSTVAFSPHRHSVSAQHTDGDADAPNEKPVRNPNTRRHHRTSRQSSRAGCRIWTRIYASARVSLYSERPRSYRRNIVVVVVVHSVRLFACTRVRDSSYSGKKLRAGPQCACVGPLEFTVRRVVAALLSCVACHTRARLCLREFTSGKHDSADKRRKREEWRRVRESGMTSLGMSPQCVQCSVCVCMYRVHWRANRSTRMRQRMPMCAPKRGRHFGVVAHNTHNVQLPNCCRGCAHTVHVYIYVYVCWRLRECYLVCLLYYIPFKCDCEWCGGFRCGKTV